MNYVIGALAGLVWGALGAYLNSLITKKCLAAGDEKAIVGMNLAHMAVDIAMRGGFFAAPENVWTLMTSPPANGRG